MLARISRCLRSGLLGSSANTRIHERRVCTVREDWCAYFINLSRRPDRRTRLLRKLSEGNKALLRRLKRIDAVDGRGLSLDDDSLSLVVDREALDRARRAEELSLHTIVHDGNSLVHFDNHLTVGGIACALSHRCALEHIAEHPTASWGLILEDDISQVVPNADVAIGRVLAQLPDDWGAVFLGYHDCSASVHPVGVCGKSTIDDVRRMEVQVERMREPTFGFHSWMIRKHVARRAVDHAFPIDGQVDHALSSWLLRDCSVYRVSKDNMLFHSPKSEESCDSDVQTMAKLEAVEKEHGSLNNYVYHSYDLCSDMYDYLLCDLSLAGITPSAGSPPSTLTSDWAERMTLDSKEFDSL